MQKVRFSPEAWRTGKRGAIRVLYAYFEEFKVVLLIYAYAKNVREDITEDDKKAIRKSVGEVRDYLQRGGQLS